MGTHSNSQLNYEQLQHGCKNASVDYAKSLDYYHTVGYNGREIRRWAGRLKAVKPKPHEDKPQGFK